MIPTNDAALYADALAELATYDASVPNHKGRLTQVFLALKFYGAAIPGLGASTGIPVGLLESMLDDLYTKVSRSPDDSVLTLFAGTYMPRTGIRPPGKKYPANNWRNNFNLQKGVGCYASAAELSSKAFLTASRRNCPHLDPATPGSLDHAQCSLNPGPEYRGEDRLKWLQIRPARPALPQEYAAVDLSNIANFTPYIAPAGSRIPALPLAVAMYFDADAGLVTGGRAAFDMADFQGDFNMTAAEFAAYFDDDTANVHNARLLRAYRTVGYARVGAAAPPSVSPLVIATPTTRRRGAARPPAAPVLTTTTVAPPAVNTGHPAQDYVRAALEADGYAVFDVSNQRLGYDLYAVKGGRIRYVEVKSSLRTCSPVLTAYEYTMAVHYGAAYVLAVVENFDPNGTNAIHWIPDPSHSCAITTAMTTEHSVPRSSWKAAVVSLSAL